MFYISFIATKVGGQVGGWDTAFCKNTGHGASGKKKICATTRNRLISVIEYIATVDPLNSY